MLSFSKPKTVDTVLSAISANIAELNTLSVDHSINARKLADEAKDIQAQSVQAQNESDRAARVADRLAKLVE